MDSSTSEPTFRSASHLIAHAAVALGIGWLALAVIAAINWAIVLAPEAVPFFDLPLREIHIRLSSALVRVMPLIASAAATAYIGIRLRSRMSMDTIRPAVAMVSFMAMVSVLIVPAIFDGFCFEPFAIVRGADEPWTFILAATMALPLYVVLCRWVLKHDEIPSGGIRDVLTVPVLVWAALLVAGYAFIPLVHVLRRVLLYHISTILLLSVALAACIGIVTLFTAVYLLNRRAGKAGARSRETIGA